MPSFVSPLTAALYLISNEECYTHMERGILTGTCLSMVSTYSYFLTHHSTCCLQNSAIGCSHITSGAIDMYDLRQTHEVDLQPMFVHVYVYDLMVLCILCSCTIHTVCICTLCDCEEDCVSHQNSNHHTPQHQEKHAQT